jgi:hypothetical protein
VQTVVARSRGIAEIEEAPGVRLGLNVYRSLGSEAKPDSRKSNGVRSTRREPLVEQLTGIDGARNGVNTLAASCRSVWDTSRRTPTFRDISGRRCRRFKSCHPHQ